MYCKVCKNALLGIWDPSRTPRVATLEGFMANVDGPVPNKPLILEESERPCSSFVYGLHIGEPSPDCEICGPRVKQWSLGNFQKSYFEILEFSNVFYLLYDDSHQSERNDPSITLVIIDQDGGANKHRFMSARDSELREQIPLWLDRSATGWSRMEAWLNTCLDSHARCALISTAEPHRPTRLLQFERDTWRIVSSQDVPHALEYVALSYCWGTGPTDGVLMLLTSTVAQLGRAQPIAMLPQTFKDAARVAMHFGVHYLWIDRLCIVQDSEDDWAFESSRMMDVYQNAKFSIAALDAANADTGLFTSKEPERHLVVNLELQPTEDAPLMPYVDSLLALQAFVGMVFGPLWPRGWVFQERLLARRTMYFGRKQIYWECHESQCCERVPSGTIQAVDHMSIDWGWYNKMRDLLPGGSFPWKPLIQASAQTDHKTTAYEQIFIEWSSIVEEYSSKMLTFSSDKLIAISGVAKAVKFALHQVDPHRPHRYVAGHWEEDLLPSLTWVSLSRARKQELRPDPKRYLAPSWSWASLIRSEIKQPVSDPNWHICASVRHIEVVNVTEDDTGAISGAELTLHGPHSTVAIHDGEGHPEIPSNYRSLRDGQVTFQDNRGEVIAQGPGRGSDLHIMIDVCDIGEAPTDVLWIAACPAGKHSKRYTIRGLLLAETGDGGFRRLGVTILYKNSKKTCLDFIENLGKETFRIV